MQPFRGWLWILNLICVMSCYSKIRYNMDWGLPNLITTDRSAVHEEDTITILLRTRYCNSLTLITMNQGPYFKDPRPRQFNVNVRCHEAVHGPRQTVRKLSQKSTRAKEAVVFAYFQFSVTSFCAVATTKNEFVFETNNCCNNTKRNYTKTEMRKK
jgi:hypothetical protein